MNDFGLGDKVEVIGASAHSAINPNYVETQEWTSGNLKWIHSLRHYAN